MKLSIIIPVFDEALWIRSFWARFAEAPVDQCPGIDAVEMLVVDDGSTDGTTEILAELCADGLFEFTCGLRAEVRFLPQDGNRGKGAAVRTGIDASSGDVVIVQDADLEYSPGDYPALLEPITSGYADAVYGSRFAGHPRRVLYFWHQVVNGFLTLLSNMLSNLNLTDMETCYKAMRGDLARSLRLVSNRFGIEPELTARLARARARIFEVPVSYRGRTYLEGKKIRVRDGIAALFHVLRFNLFDREPFKPGLMQTLTALDRASTTLYRPFLAKALEGEAPSRGSRRILEVGAGMGSITRHLMPYGRVTATDIAPKFVDVLRDRFQQFVDFEARTWDASAPPPSGLGPFDVLVSINVLEHLEDDVEALAIWRSLLAPEGRLLLLVPQGPGLFSPIDEALGHFRRYRKADLLALIREAGFEVESARYVNALGILGWWFRGRVLRKSDLPVGQIRIYRVLKTLFRWVEAPLERFTGLSIVVEARKSGS